jgi:hypothetical protein
MVAYICNPSYWGGRDKGESSFQASPGKKLARPHLNGKSGHGGATMGNVGLWFRPAKHLPYKLEVLNSSPSIRKKERER